IFIPLSLLSPVTFSLFLSLLPRELGRATLRLLGDGPATTGRADLHRCTIGSTSVSPSRPDRPPPRGRPELAGKPCFPTEVRPKPSELPARNSPSFLHQIDRVRHQEPDRIAKETFEGSKGDFAEISTEV
ncbi:hypothetical protein Prudu_009054, partial [Prunus dulcis]